MISRLMLDDMSAFESAICMRSITALERVQTPGCTANYLRCRMLAAAARKGYILLANKPDAISTAQGMQSSKM